jgi:CoA:oxalate CoA-transferase
MIVAIDDPDAGPLKLAGNPIKMSDFPDPTSRPAAPALDENRAAILRSLGEFEATDEHR